MTYTISPAIISSESGNANGNEKLGQIEELWEKLLLLGRAERPEET